MPGSSMVCPIAQVSLKRDCPNRRCMWFCLDSAHHCIRSTCNPTWQQLAEFKGLEPSEEVEAEATQNIKDFIIFLRYVDETEAGEFAESETLDRILCAPLYAENKKLLRAVKCRIAALVRKEHWIKFADKYNLDHSKRHLCDVLRVTRDQLHSLQQET